MSRVTKENLLTWVSLKANSLGVKIRGLCCLQILWAAAYRLAVQGFHRLFPGTLGNTSPQHEWLWFLVVLFFTTGLTCSRLCKLEAVSYAGLLGGGTQVFQPRLSLLHLSVHTQAVAGPPLGQASINAKGPAVSSRTLQLSWRQRP